MKKFVYLGLSLAFISGCQSFNDGPTVKYKVIDEAPYLREASAYVVPERTTAPQIYSIAANRVTNRMLDGTRDIYDHSGDTFLYIMSPKTSGEQTPDGFYAAERVIRGTIEGSHLFKLVNNLNEADYYVQPVIEDSGTPEAPALTVKLVLFDNKNIKINEWSETMRPLRNDDQSWW